MMNSIGGVCFLSLQLYWFKLNQSNDLFILNLRLVTICRYGSFLAVCYCLMSAIIMIKLFPRSIYIYLTYNQYKAIVRSINKINKLPIDTSIEFEGFFLLRREEA